jgi:hypothetical protein
VRMLTGFVRRLRARSRFELYQQDIPDESTLGKSRWTGSSRYRWKNSQPANLLSMEKSERTNRFISNRKADF